MGVHPINPDAGARRLDTILNPMVDRMSPIGRAANELGPKYVAEGREVVTVTSGRRYSLPHAREYLNEVVQDALSVRHEEVAEIDLVLIADLVRAIRAAERNDPTPPASMARAAA